jgi:hypothetical protein
MKASTSFSQAAERGIPLAFQDVTRDGYDALVAAGLNYTIEDVPLSNLTDARFANRWHAAVRSNDGALIGVNSSRFAHHQPQDLAVLGEAIVSIRDDAYFSAGGQSADGRTQFLIVTLGEGFDDGDGGMYRNILLLNGTNGNAMLQGIAFNHRVVCMNQFPAIRKGGASLFKLGHTWSAKLALPTAVTALQDATRIWDDMDREIERLLSIPITYPGELAEQIAGVKPADKEEGQANRALTEWEKRFTAIVDEYRADWNANIHGTGWGMVMAAQAVDEHHGRVRGGERDLQRINRIAEDRYPMMTRALALV